MRLRGSVIPSAAFIALFPTAATVIVHFWQDDIQTVIPPNLLELDKLRSFYQTFTWVLAFLLVFRTQLAYNRYWEGANLMRKMTAEWSDACSQAMCFADTSSHSPEQVQSFQGALARLFSLLHGLALQDIAVMEDECFESLDLKGLDPDMVEGLQRYEEPGEKAEIVIQWIERLILEACKSGLIPTPPPIVSRFFQEMHTGLISYRQMVVISEIEFPFPYAQVISLGLLIHLCMTPILVGTMQESHFATVAVFAFISTCFLFVLTLIAQEIELPFGDDANDLDCAAVQRDLNKSLMLLLTSDARCKLNYTTPLTIPGQSSLDIVKSSTCLTPVQTFKKSNFIGQSWQTNDTSSGYKRRMTQKEQKAIGSSRSKSIFRRNSAAGPVSRETLAEKKRSVAARASIELRAGAVSFQPDPIPLQPEAEPSKPPPEITTSEMSCFLQDVVASIKSCEELNTKSCSEVSVSLSRLVELHELTLRSVRQLWQGHHIESPMPNNAKQSVNAKQYHVENPIPNNTTFGRASNAKQSVADLQVPEERWL